MKLTSQGFKVQHPSAVATPRVLMLILASDNNPVFLEHQRIWRSYMHTHPNIKAFFYKANPSLESEFCIIDDVLWVRCEESLYTVYEKTLKAFDAVLPMLQEYDFVFRPNLSSFVILDRYLEFCKNFPRMNLCAALIGDYGNIKFPTGAGFTLSCDVVRRLTEVRPPLFCQDDVTIGKALQEWNIPIYFAPRTDINSWESYIHADTTGFHYRLKHAHRQASGNMHEEELRIMTDLRNRVYGYPTHLQGS